MVELSDSLDTVGKLRYNEKFGMLGVTTDPYTDTVLQETFGQPTKCFLRGISQELIDRMDDSL